MHPAPSTDLPDDAVLSVRHVSKKFCRNLRRSMWYGMTDLGRHLLGLRPGAVAGEHKDSASSPSPLANNRQPIPDSRFPIPNNRQPITNNQLRRDEFWALRDIDFDLKRGEVLGLIGSNGSGKSTLLRIITGVFPPDTGVVAYQGRIGGLIALGAGMHPHMTGRENIYLNGTILGLTRSEIAASFDAIVDFADIGDFLEAPVTTYSSGMHVRLGFAIAIHCIPNIVVLDEVLAVGDARFQRKCLDRVRDLRKDDKSFILVSHNMQNIEAMCDRVLLLDRGRPLRLGPPEEVIPEYELMQAGDDRAGARPPEHVEDGGLQHLFSYKGFGTDEVTITSLSVLDASGTAQTEFTSGGLAAVRVRCRSSRPLAGVYVWLVFVHVEDPADRERDTTCVGVRSQHDLVEGDMTIECAFAPLHLSTGIYKINFCIFDDTFLQPYAQGFYGYITARHPVPTLLRNGRGVPFVWLPSDVSVRETSKPR
jgi:lipopolysaccharide transport system ATP-binding protein